MIKPEDLIKVEFSRSFLGYDMKEVDALLDAVIEQMEAWEKERSEMLTALEYLLQEIEQQEKSNDEPLKKQLQAREKASRIAKAKTEMLTDGIDENLFSDEQAKKRSRKKTSGKASRAEQPLPQAVAEPMPEQPQELPLAKAYSAVGAEASFEIPTYVFAGASVETDGAAGDGDLDTADKQSGEIIPVAEEVEMAVDAASDASHAFDSTDGTESTEFLSKEQEA